MGHPFYIINKLNGHQVNALFFPIHGFTKEGLRITGKFIQEVCDLYQKETLSHNPYFKFQKACYHLSKDTYQDDLVALEYQGRQDETQKVKQPLPCYFLLDEALITELLSYQRPVVTLNWQLRSSDTLDLEKSTLDIDGLLTKTPSQNPQETIKPDDYLDETYYHQIMSYLSVPKHIQTKHIPINQHLFILGRLQPAWYDTKKQMIYQIIQ